LAKNRWLIPEGIRTPKLAIIGLGKMGLLHAGVHSALQGAPLIVASEKEGFIVRMIQKMIPQAKIYEDYTEMVANEPDLEGVVITTPIHTHAPIIMDILKARENLGIFVEKPLCTNYSDAVKICTAVKRTKCANMVGFQKRYAATFKRAKDLLSTGEIGQPQFFKSYSFMSDIFRKGKGWRFDKESGGVTLEVGPHLLDLLIWYFGEPERLTGFRKRLYSEQVEDYVHAAMEFPSGLAGYADISWSIRNYRLPEVYVEVNGTNGVLTVCDDYVKLQLEGDSATTPAGTYLHRRPQLQPSVPFLLGDPEFCLQDQVFQDNLQTGRSSEPDFEDAAKVNSLMDKIGNL